MPVFMAGSHFLEKISTRYILVFPWTILTVVLPLAASTIDFTWGRGQGPFSAFWPRFSREAFKGLYLPAWGRIFVWFISSILSISLLQLAGIKLN